MEQWKKIEGYEGLYWVSDQGRVKNREGKIMKPIIDKRGYLRITLHKNNQPKSYYMQRLVALAFIPNSDPEKNQVNHKSEIKTDNRVENLEFCTVKYNNNYGTRNERVREKHYKKVLCIETGKIFNSAKEAAKHYNL